MARGRVLERGLTRMRAHRQRDDVSSRVETARGEMTRSENVRVRRVALPQGRADRLLW